MNLLILAEKPDQAKIYAKDLGGMTGQLGSDHYQIVNAAGHLYELKNPDEQVDNASLKARYADWNDLKAFPWNPKDFKWRKQVSKGKSKFVKQIRDAGKNADALVIATDNDPTGEGDLLACEILEQINWRKPVYREFHEDETARGLKKALATKKDISDYQHYRRYLKALGRQRFDFTSMQLSRIATILAREAGYNVKVLRFGRLKLVIVALVYHQLQLIASYVKTPFYEVRYQDDYGNVLKREFHEGEDHWRFPTKKLAEHDLTTNYLPDSIVVDSKHIKRQQPPKMLDMTQLSILLGRKGYKNKAIMATYQQMYQDHVVSYPRTEDSAVTIDQYKQLLPHREQIAKVVGVDPKLLTHLKPRKKHIVASAAHGANRPSDNIPSSLGALEKKYGKLGRLIYEAVAKSYLAILCEDYEYLQEKGHIASHPEFKGTVNVPKQYNYKVVFDEAKLKDDDEKKGQTTHGFGQMAAGYVYSGANPKPRKPNRGFILGYLERNNIGTPSTRVKTLADVSENKNSMLKSSKGAYTLTEIGWLSAFISRGTMIANPKTTKQIFGLMKQVETGKIQMPVIPNLMTQVVNHDLPVMKANAAKLVHDDNPIAKHVKKVRSKQMTSKPKVTGEVNGEQIKFSSSWGGHTFTATEKAKLLAGKSITFKFKKKNGEIKEVTGKLARQRFHGHQFWGFKPEW